jgi:hypothetical protein
MGNSTLIKKLDDEVYGEPPSSSWPRGFPRVVSGPSWGWQIDGAATTSAPTDQGCHFSKLTKLTKV